MRDEKERKEAEMTDSSEKRSAREFRWIPRILGIPIGLIMLMEVVEGFVEREGLDTAGIWLRVCFFVILAGCVAGWFNELIGSILILAGTAVIGVMAAREPRALWMLAFPAVVGFLFLYAHLLRKKKGDSADPAGPN